jgi:two-component system phosphate regulon sensor histidine kinase PhoR
MKNLRWLAILMGVVIVAITGFQLYWLKQNYDREEKTLSIKSEVTFHETVQQLQVVKFKLGNFKKDTTHKGKVRVFMNDGERMDIKMLPRQEIVSTINVLRNKLSDSLKRNPGIKSGMVISMDKNSVHVTRDSFRRGGLPRSDDDTFLQVLYGVDSLQDSLTLKEINTAYVRALKEQNLDIPFTINRLDSAQVSDEPQFNEVTIGFVNPITYRLKLGNTFPYLLKRISLPILFSIVLLGITILCFILLYRNILKQQRLAELKNEFISNITHELKTPIATVGVAIEALKNFNAIQDPQRTREYLDISSNELQRLGLLVDKVLKLSMFEKKEIDLKYENLNLKDVVDEVVLSMRLQLEKCHATVVVTNEGNLDMQGDRLHLQSVIFNLLDNALKYGKGDISIQIDIKQQGDKLVINVTDNGIGIPAEYKEKVFEKFFRVPHGNTHNAKGYGLGLSYVSHVIQKHKGTIAVESQAGIGSKFVITLPKQNI